jgi:hypothetical protein
MLVIRRAAAKGEVDTNDFSIALLLKKFSRRISQLLYIPAGHT